MKWSVCRKAQAVEESLWTHLETLVSSAELVIDRTQGSVDPRHPGITLDYGYLPGSPRYTR